jgi:hypothetical protein
VDRCLARFPVTSVVGLVLALSKIVPLLNRLLDALQEARVAQAHNAIDQAIQNARNGPFVCPYGACPMRVRNNPQGAAATPAP